MRKSHQPHLPLQGSFWDGSNPQSISNWVVVKTPYFVIHSPNFYGNVHAAPKFFGLLGFGGQKVFLTDFPFLKNKQKTATAWYLLKILEGCCFMFSSFFSTEDCKFGNNFRKLCSVTEPQIWQMSWFIFLSDAHTRCSKLKIQTSISHHDIHGSASVPEGASSRLVGEHVMRKGNSAVCKTNWQSWSTFSANSLPAAGWLAIPDK